MNERIKNLYNNIIPFIVLNDKRFKIVCVIRCAKASITTSIDCSKYAKFLINDFNGVRKQNGESIMEKIESQKLLTLLSISEEYAWFDRKDIVEFIKTY